MGQCIPISHLKTQPRTIGFVSRTLNDIRKTLKAVSRNKKNNVYCWVVPVPVYQAACFQTDLKISDMRFLDPQAPINLFVGKGPSLLANGWIMCEISRTLDVKISTSCRSVLVDISVVE